MLRGLLAVLAVLALHPVEACAEECVGPVPTARRILKNHPAVFVGTVVSTDPAVLVRYKVTERFAGKLGPYVDIHPFPGERLHPGIGRQYLVFADRCPWEPGKKCLTSSTCFGTRPLEAVHAVIPQLRADRGGRPMASVYGNLLYQERENHYRPLPGIVVRLHSAGKSFETRTDEQGVYAFQRLKGGIYQVSAGLPPNMEIAEMLGRPAEPFELPSNSSLEHDILAFPTGRIAGTVIGPGGKPIRAASLSLYRADQYREAEAGGHDYQGPRESRSVHRTPFAFDHLPDGDYLLVFNDSDKVERALLDPRDDPMPDGRNEKSEDKRNPRGRKRQLRLRDHSDIRQRLVRGWRFAAQPERNPARVDSKQKHMRSPGRVSKRGNGPALDPGRNGSIVVRPLRRRHEPSEPVSRITPGNRHRETHWGQPQGKESW